MLHTGYVTFVFHFHTDYNRHDPAVPARAATSSKDDGHTDRGFLYGDSLA
jgi:hypothetical protein